MQARPTWAVVLAGGDGMRLSALTVDAQGRHVPKQYCSLGGGWSLLELALARAKPIVPGERICVVVAKEHEHWWRPLIERGLIDEENLIVQPRNRGTGNGALLALSCILKRDPRARLVFLPADHHVLNEVPLIQAMASMLVRVDGRSTGIFLLGIEPDDAAPELGYIIPQNAANNGAQGVRHFIERPSRGVAGQLIQQGGVWNSGIFAANGSSLMKVFKERFPDNVLGFQAVLSRMSEDFPRHPPRALGQLYDRLQDIDFSHHILQRHIADLQVALVHRCGWSDLGTPHRLAERVNRLAGEPEFARDRPGETGLLDLVVAVRAMEKEGNVAAGAREGAVPHSSMNVHPEAARRHAPPG